MKKLVATALLIVPFLGNAKVGQQAEQVSHGVENVNNLQAHPHGEAYLILKVKNGRLISHSIHGAESTVFQSAATNYVNSISQEQMQDWSLEKDGVYTISMKFTLF